MRLQVIDDQRAGSGFVSRLTHHMARLGASLCVTSGAPYDTSADVAVIFAERPTNSHDAYLAGAVQRDIPVFGVIAEASQATTHLPSAVRHLNAFVRKRYERAWDVALCDEVLAAAWLPRKQRKLFISYRRDDTHDVAEQLHGELTALGFEVFLDEVSIPRAANIRTEIERQLEDVDAVVLLASPLVTVSQWVLDEAAFAMARGIAVIGVCWPGNQLSPPTGPLANDQCIHLAGPITRSTVLTAAELELVIGGIHERRALAIKTRIDQLLPLATRLASERKKWSVTPTVKLGDLEDRAAPAFVRVVPHRPSIVQLADARKAGAAAGPNHEVACCYCESNPQHPTVEAMRDLFERGTPPPCWLWAYEGKIK